MENNEKPQNYVELTEGQIFEKIKEDLNPIQENLSEKKITVDEAKSELKKINEWIQGTKLEHEKKKEIGNTFDSLINNLEANFERNNLETEFNEVVKLVETLTKKDLANLEKNIKRKHILWQSEQGYENETQYLAKADEGRKESSNNLEKTVHEAAQDQHPWAKKFGERMENLMA